MTTSPTTVTLVGGEATVSFTARYSYMEIENLSATDAMYVRADGVQAVAGADDNYYVGPGETTMVANGLPMFWQGFGGPMGTAQLGGEAADPGTTISVAGTGTDSLTVIGR